MSNSELLPPSCRLSLGLYGVGQASSSVTCSQTVLQLLTQGLHSEQVTVFTYPHRCKTPPLTRHLGLPPMAQMVKNLPAGNPVPFPAWSDPLEKEMATYSSILPWKIPWTEEPGRLQSMGSRRVGYDRTDLLQTLALEKVISPLQF